MIYSQIDGLASFNVCIHDLMTYNSDHFRGVLMVEAVVMTSDGHGVRAHDASCPVHKHLVDVEFTKDTARHFKPGLPYRGKVGLCARIYVNRGLTITALKMFLYKPRDQRVFLQFESTINVLVSSYRFI